jgi:hypothetical protein
MRTGASPKLPHRRGPLTGVSILVARTRWILPRADAACGRAFHPNRPTAETHRVALALWYRATVVGSAEPRLAVYRCKRCFGFHIARKRIGHELVGPG